MGVLLALTGALAFSFMNVFVRNGARPDDPDTGVLTTLVINVLAFGVLLVAWWAVTGLPGLRPDGVAWFVLAGLCSTFLGRQSLFGAIRLIGAARGAAIKNATPLVTVVIALTILGERLTLAAAAGVALVMIGVFALIAESLAGAGRGLGAASPDDPIGAAVESEALAETGLVARTRGFADRTVAMVRAPSRRGVLLGAGLAIVAAVAFGAGHALRKLGMDVMPNALLGAMIGSTTALVTYGAAAAVRGELALETRRSLTTVRPWFWAAGVAGTVGQLSFFAALAFAPVAHVSVVSGSETVLTVIIAAVLAGRLEAITSRVVVPAILVFAGTALIAVAR